MKQASIYRSQAGAEAIERRYRELLDQWPVPNQRQVIPTREGDTFVVVSGPPDAPPVLAIQGSGANSAMWLRQIGGWAPHLRVYAVDVIGEPGLSAPSRPSMNSESYALWLDDVMDGLGMTRASVIGMSLGGWFALDYAIRRPERVTRLVLLTPAGIGRIKYGFLVKSMLLRCFGARGRRRSLLIVAGPAARQGVGPDTRAMELATFTMLIFKHFRPRMQRIPVVTDDQLRSLTIPVLAVVGERDVMIDSRQTARRLRTAPHAMIRSLPDAGHVLPDQTATVLDFLVGADTDKSADIAASDAALN